MRRCGFIPPLFLMILLLSTMNSPCASAQELTPEETAWLDKKPVVRVRVTNWPPYMVCKDGKFDGIALEYLRIIFEKYRISYRFVSGYDYPERDGLEMIKRRDVIDLLPSIKKTETWTSFMAYTDVYLSSPWVIFMRDDAPYISGMDDLEGKTVIVHRGFVLQSNMKEHYPEIKIRKIALQDESEEAIRAVATGEVDACISNLASGSYLIRALELHNMKVAGPTHYGDHQIAMGVRKDWPELTGILNKGMAGIPESEKNEIASRYFSLRFEHGLRIQDVIGWILGILILAAIVILLILQANIKLNREIRFRIRLEKELSSYISLVDNNILILKLDLDWNIIRGSDAYYRISGYGREELVGARLQDKLHMIGNDNPESWFAELRGNLELNKTVRGELKSCTREGEILWMKFVGSPTLNECGDKVGYTMIAQDITDKKRAEALSMIDKLTGLANRMKLDEVFSYERSLAERDKRSFSIILLDLDRFKSINDIHGHAVGDCYLRDFADVLKENVRKSDTLGRWGGDEFLIICPGVDEAGVTRLADKLREVLKSTSFRNIGPMTASFGVASYLEGDSETNLLQRADKELYLEKQEHHRMSSPHVPGQDPDPV